MACGVVTRDKIADGAVTGSWYTSNNNLVYHNSVGDVILLQMDINLEQNCNVLIMGKVNLSRINNTGTDVDEAKVNCQIKVDDVVVDLAGGYINTSVTLDAMNVCAIVPLTQGTRTIKLMLGVYTFSPGGSSFATNYHKLNATALYK